MEPSAEAPNEKRQKLSAEDQAKVHPMPLSHLFSCTLLVRRAGKKKAAREGRMERAERAGKGGSERQRNIELAHKGICRSYLLNQREASSHCLHRYTHHQSCTQKLRSCYNLLPDILVMY
jgi:hypothetical protein